MRSTRSPGRGRARRGPLHHHVQQDPAFRRRVDPDLVGGENGRRRALRRRVVAGELADPTLSFQLSRGFVVIGVAHNYLRHDPESLGHAAVIEWLNPDVATPDDYAARKAWSGSV